MRRWEEIRKDLENAGIEIVTVCTDTPEGIRRGKPLHGLEAIMLSDPDLRVTDQLGLRNQGLTVRMPWLDGLPVPTTLLVDADGIIRWIDQAEDFMRRSDPERVRTAVSAAFT